MTAYTYLLTSFGAPPQYPTARPAQQGGVVIAIYLLLFLPPRRLLAPSMRHLPQSLRIGVSRERSGAGTMTHDEAENAVTVGLASGLDYDTVTEAALAIFGPPPWLGEHETVLAVAQPRRAAAREVAVALTGLVQRLGGSSRIVKPLSRLEAMRSWNRIGPGERWQRQDVAARAERLTEVLIPRDLARAPLLIAISTFDQRDTATRPPLALSAWTAFLHPRDAIAVRLGGARLNLAAEAALAFAPDLYLLAGKVGSRRAVIATSDPIAADLVGLALWQDHLGPRAEVSGPWEDELVQHATELRLGVLSPDQIRLVARWAGPADLGTTTLSPLVERISLRLGLTGTENASQ